jgi:alpha-L-arabinofuranosidase
MLEGLTLGQEWDWKDTLGPLRNRPGFQGVWGYQQTHGLGLVEYLEWSEDMDLEIGEHYNSIVRMTNTKLWNSRRLLRRPCPGRQLH